MPELNFKMLLPLGLAVGGLLVLYHLLSGSASSVVYLYLVGLIGLEILIIALWDYQRRYLPLLLAVFLLAGVNIPLHSEWIVARWGVLAVGAGAGFAYFLKGPSAHSFGLFHLVALFAVITALVSALASAYPSIALLKTLSLLLVFLYGAAGARLALAGRAAALLAGLLRACELLVYLSALSYFVFRYPLYGNPNSLGVVMGVGVAPLLLWGTIVSEDTKSYKRRAFALTLCLLLLLSSYARAAIGATCLSSLLLCVALRRYRLLVKGGVLALLGGLLVMVVFPLTRAQTGGDFMDRLTDTFLYKGKRTEGIFESRQSPWDKTSAAIREHPWFGSGFGTSVTTVDDSQQQFTVKSVHASSREHGNSYLAIAEWTGLLGVAPFYLMVVLVVVNIGRVALWMRRTGNPFSPAVPIAAVLAGGVFHAIFEDWLFAVGYYMCVFFWVLAFMLVDVLPGPEVIPKEAPTQIRYPRQRWGRIHDAIVPGR